MRTAASGSPEREADEAVMRLLAAQADALSAIAACNRDASSTIEDARALARRILSRTDARIASLRQQLAADADARCARLREEAERLRRNVPIDGLAPGRINAAIERIVAELAGS